jgi:hypothetical protein
LILANLENGGKGVVCLMLQVKLRLVSAILELHLQKLLSMQGAQDAVVCARTRGKPTTFNKSNTKTLIGNTT